VVDLKKKTYKMLEKYVFFFITMLKKYKKYYNIFNVIIMKESILFLKNLNIDKNKHLVVATSGGPDSMALLHLLNSNGYKVICAHVNHGLRVESEEEYKFVENYSKINNIIFEGMKIECYKNNKFTENEARQKRYAFFETILNKYNTDILLTAHHGDDLVETVLMRIIRGSNLSGYKGFTKITEFNNFKIIRPLIFYTKKEIEEYIKENNIPVVYDKSNESKKYTRNRIRLDVLPLLKSEEKHIHKKVLEYSEELNDINDYVNDVVKEKVNEMYKENKLNINKFTILNKVIKIKVLESILFDIYKDKINIITKKHIEEILKVIDSYNKKIDLPNNIIVEKEYSNLIFKEKENNKTKNYKIIIDKDLNLNELGKFEFINDTPLKSNYVIKLNSKEITLPLILRNKEEKDVMQVKNLNGTKKVKKIFIDEKIPVKIRNGYPLLTDSDNKVLWIPGIKKSIFDCYNKDNYDIIIKYTREGDIINEEK